MNEDQATQPAAETKPQTIAEAENSRGSAEPNEVAPVEETVPANVEPTPVQPEKTEAELEVDKPIPPDQPTQVSDVPTETSVEEKKEELSPADPEIITVRSEETGDKVYAVRQNKRYWVKNPESLAKMGFYLGKEKKIPFSELLGYSEGEPIDLTVPEAVYPWDKPEEEQKNDLDNSQKIWS